MIAEPTERRRSKRFTVEAGRAEVVVEFGGEDHRAVLSDMSATGFGLLLLKGSRVAPGSHVQLTDSETDTTFDLEVVHVRPEDGFQYVGLRRVSDKTPLTIPLFRFAGKTYKLTMPGFSPLIYFAVVFGFSGSAIMMMEFLQLAGSGAKQTPNSVHEQAIMAERPRLSLEEKRRRIFERTHRASTKTVTSRQNLELTPSFWERITGPNREQVGRLVGGRNISWSQLVSRLGLSKAQQDRVQALLNSNDQQAAEAARLRMMSLLTDEQRSTYQQMLATLPLN
ncbi:MAG: PilZ domain-containing protein [Planctomycetota bacterium]|nr:PilZ domain-containing protein [Planctomycetota bacterium]MDA0921052.1 PilZ domain-containing protein [Planctomycetota bacterium]MDA1159561.1 PilZ domain-containing protein [Planctomycetota bacterium]